MSKENKETKKHNLPQGFIDQQWKKGVNPYRVFLESLTPEEYKAHLEERKHRRQLKRAMEEVFAAQTSSWLALLNNSAAKLLQRAAETGDPQAFVAVYDRLIGKPTLNIDAELSEKPVLPWRDDD
jgi:type III secretory pathway component EscR